MNPHRLLAQRAGHAKPLRVGWPADQHAATSCDEAREAGIGLRNGRLGAHRGF